MMENLINDLLDLAKLEHNQFKISNDYFDLASTIYEAFQIIAHQATENKIKLKATIDKSSNLNLIRSIYGDQRRFLQILLNFLSNSLKFTNPNGSVHVEINIINE
jgi:signal transduction histidine kinase